MPAIASLSHVGLHVKDLESQKRFYQDILGLQVTDEDPQAGMVFMSARPEEEHHELLLTGGRNVGDDARLLQQVSFRCNSLDDVIGYYQRFKERGVKFDMIVTHGNAVAVYFYDPEGNRCEVFWDTGLKARQPFLIGVDLDQPADELRREIEEAVRRYGETGYVDMSVLQKHNIG